jgi:hypothetical protein
MMATVAVALAGCAADGNTPGASSSSAIPSAPAGSSASAGSSADPAAASALASATAALGTTSFKITMTSGPGVKLTGFVDAPGNKGTGTLAITGPNADIQVKTLLVDQDLYVQVPGITKAGTWTHVNVARLPEGANVGLRPGQIDPANTAKVLTSTTDVQQVDPRSFRGTLDLTKATGVTGVDKVKVDGWGAAAQRVPFTAGLDDQGRLATMTIQLPAVGGQPAQPLEVLYTDYGTVVAAQKPPADQVTEAPESLYTTLGR